MVVTLLSKYDHFIDLYHHESATDSAQFFVHHVYLLHGLLWTIFIDRETIFFSKWFWQELFSILEVAIHNSSTSYPQTDGQIEAVKKCLERYLRCMCGDGPKELIH